MDGASDGALDAKLDEVFKLDASPETDADYSTKNIYHLLRPATRTWRGNTSSS